MVRPYTFTRYSNGQVAPAASVDDLQAAIEDIDANGTIGGVGSGSLASKDNGVAVLGSTTAIDVRGSKVQAKDGGSGITLIFTIPTIDLYYYMQANPPANFGVGVSGTVRAANDLALQAALSACHANTNGARKILIPGDTTYAFEFDAPMTVDGGVAISSDLKQALGPQLHYYGATNTDAIHLVLTGGSGLASYFSWEGLRLECKSGNPGTGRGLFLEVTNGTHIEGGFFRGFARNVYCLQNDIIDIRNTWFSWATDTSLYLNQPFNNTLIEMNVFEAVNASAPGQINCMAIHGGASGGFADSACNILSNKFEGDVPTVVGLLMDAGTPGTLISGWTIRGGGSPSTPFYGMADAVLVTGVNKAGLDERIAYRHINTRADNNGPRCQNLLHIVTLDGGDYAIPGTARAILSRDTTGTVLFTEIAPSVAGGTGAGTTPTVSVVGTDRRGRISVQTGTTPTASGQVVTLTFSMPYSRVPYIQISPANGAAAALSGNQQVFCANDAGTRVTRTSFDLTAGSSALTAATTYLWEYQVMG